MTDRDNHNLPYEEKEPEYVDGTDVGNKPHTPTTPGTPDSVYPPAEFNTITPATNTPIYATAGVLATLAACGLGIYGLTHMGDNSQTPDTAAEQTTQTTTPEETTQTTTSAPDTSSSAPTSTTLSSTAREKNDDNHETKKHDDARPTDAPAVDHEDNSQSGAGVQPDTDSDMKPGAGADVDNTVPDNQTRPYDVSSQSPADQYVYGGSQLYTHPWQPNTTTQPIAHGSMYTVQQGDTVSYLAQRSGASIADVVAVNGIVNPDLIYTGSTLYIP